MCCRPKIKTTVEVTEEDSGSHSKVSIRTRDRPGLLTDIVRTLKDISVNVISAEVIPYLAFACLGVTMTSAKLAPTLPFMHQLTLAQAMVVE